LGKSFASLVFLAYDFSCSAVLGEVKFTGVFLLTPYDPE